MLGRPKHLVPGVREARIYARQAVTQPYPVRSGWMFTLLDPSSGAYRTYGPYTRDDAADLREMQIARVAGEYMARASNLDEVDGCGRKAVSEMSYGVRWDDAVRKVRLYITGQLGLSRREER
jgi:hypothetical protein